MGGSIDGYYKPSKLEKISYGFGDFGISFCYGLANSYATFYYSDVYIVGGDPTKSTSITSNIFVFSQLVDVFWCLFLGVFIDKHQSLFGKYRFYLLFGGIPLTLFSIVCFWDHFKPSILYAILTFIGLQTSYSLVIIPYFSLNTFITRDIKEINSMAFTRIFLACLGDFFIYPFAPILVSLFAGEEIPTNFVFFQLIGAFPGLILLPLLSYFKKLFGKKGAFYVFGTVSILGFAMIYIVSKMGIDSKYNALMCIANSIKTIGFSMLIGYMWILILEVIIYAEYTTGRRIAGIVNAISMIFFKIGAGFGNAFPGWILDATEYLAGEEEENTLNKDSHAWLLTSLLYSIVGFILLLICFAKTKERIIMNTKETKKIKYSDIWTELKSNRPLRIVGYYFICTYLCLHFGNASVPYLYGMSKQSETTKEGIRLMATIIPIIISILMMVIISFYKLSDENIEEISQEIEKRRNIEENLNIS